MQNKKKINQEKTFSRVYKTVYSRKLSPKRAARYQSDGLPVCPECGAELIRKTEQKNKLICIRCGCHFDYQPD